MVLRPTEYMGAPSRALSRFSRERETSTNSQFSRLLALDRLLVLLSLFVACSTAFAAPRLAIFTKEPDIGALLTSSLKGCEILSRSDLPKATAEAILSGTPQALEGADLALILEKTDRTTNVRLVSASTGATMANWMAPPLPADELARWIALRAEPFLSLSAKADTPRISLVGLRFETDSAVQRSEERQANLMLATEFQAAGAVVLERWRLGDLVFEKSLLPEDSAFWKDATLLDGSLKTAGTGYSASIRLRRPGAADSNLTLEAASLDDLVRQIASLSLSHPAKIPRDRQTEPSAFIAECRWMLANGLPREAWQAAEAALALGAEGKEPQMLRIKAAAMTAYPDDLRVMHGMPGGYQPSALPLEEMETRMAAATEAMLLAGDYLARNSPCEPPDKWSLEHPPTLAVQSLYTGLRLLRKAYDSGWAATHPEQVQSLRAAVQRNIGLIRKTPLDSVMQSTFYSCLSCMAAYWNSSPAETIAFYRDVLRPEFPGGHSRWAEGIRHELFYGKQPYPPFLVGTAPKEDFPWDWNYSRVIDTQNHNARKVWEDFLNEMAASPSPLSRADSLAARWHSTAVLSARYALTSQIVDFLHAEIPALHSKDGPAIFQDFIEPLREVNQTRNLAEAQARLVEFFQRIVQSPDPLPPGILSKVGLVAHDQKLNVREDQILALLSAIEARTSRSKNDGESEELASARSALLKEFPMLRKDDSPQNAITATKYWLVSEAAPSRLKWKISFHPEGAIWHQNALWILDPFAGHLWQVRPETGETKVIDTADRPKTSFDSMLAAWGDQMAVTTEDGVCVLDKNRTAWRKIDLPPTRYTIGVSGDFLWAASADRPAPNHDAPSTGTTLYRITPDLKPALFASSRRRPAQHILDQKLRGQPFAILPAENDGVVIATSDNDWIFLNSNTGQEPAAFKDRFLCNLRFSSNPQLVVQRYQAGKHSRIARVDLFTPQGNFLLLSNPKIDNGKDPRFPFPPELDDFPAAEFAVTWNGATLGIFGWSSEGTPSGASRSRLFLIRDGKAASAPVLFDWGPEIAPRAQAEGRISRLDRYPQPGPKGLVSTPEGFVVTGRGMDGFWFIPNSLLPPEFR